MYLYTKFFSLSFITYHRYFQKILFMGISGVVTSCLQRFSCLKLLFPHKETVVSPQRNYGFSTGKLQFQAGKLKVLCRKTISYRSVTDLHPCKETSRQ